MSIANILKLAGGVAVLAVGASAVYVGMRYKKAKTAAEEESFSKEIAFHKLETLSAKFEQLIADGEYTLTDDDNIDLTTVGKLTVSSDLMELDSAVSIMTTKIERVTKELCRLASNQIVAQLVEFRNLIGEDRIKASPFLAESIKRTEANLSNGAGLDVLNCEQISLRLSISAIKESNSQVNK